MTHPIAGAHPPPGRPREEALLDGLTPEQTQAVQHGPGPLLLIAGPGAGKTKTLIHRIARLLATGAAQPWEILAVTFSVRAAGELRLRLADLLGEQVARGVTAATFHSICARMLREHAGVFGRTESYTVYDQADVRRVIEWLLSDQQRGRIQQALADHGQPAASEVLAEISLAKNRLLSPNSYEQHARHTAAPLIAAVWRELDVELQRSNSIDFDDLLVLAVRLLAEHPHRLAFYRQRWRWLVADEYQDTNEAQSVLVALLAGAGGNVCCVADDDQLIYSWRGAQSRNILAFGERFPAHARIVLGRNFRCRSEILDAAVACVAHNVQREAKALIAMRGGGGEVRVIAYGSDRHEAECVAAAIGQALARGIPAGEVLVLARTGYATAPVQAALARAGIPHRVLGSLGLYERSEVQRRARLSRAARQPRRRPGIPPRRRLTQTRCRHHDRQPGDLARPRHTSGRPDHGECERERTRGDPLPHRPREAHAVWRRTRPRPSRAARRALARARRRHRGDARRRTRRPPPAPARQLAETRGAPGRRTGARGPALPVPRRPGLRGATHRQRHPDRVSRAGRRPARPRDRPGRTGPEDHRLDRSTGPRGPRRSSSCCSAARSGCCRPGARSHHPTVSSWPRSAACSTSPAPAPKTN